MATRVLTAETELLIALFAGDAVLPSAPSVALAVRLCEALEPVTVSGLVEVVLGDAEADASRYALDCLEWGFDIWVRGRGRGC